MVKFFCLCNFSSASFIVAVELDSGSIGFDCIIRMTCVSSHHCECCKVARAKSHSQKLQRILSQEWETAAEPGNLPSLPQPPPVKDRVPLHAVKEIACWFACGVSSTEGLPLGGFLVLHATAWLAFSYVAVLLHLPGDYSFTMFVLGWFG